MSDQAFASSFHISPILGDVPQDNSSITFKVRNTDNKAIVLDISAKKWGQYNRKDILVPDKNLLIIPPVVSIQSGDTQLVRIAMRQKRPPKELAYRLFFKEIPPSLPGGVSGIQTALQLNIPLFFAPQEVKHLLDWQYTKDINGKPILRVSNQGTRFARFSSLQLSIDGKKLLELSGPLYVLAGTTSSWPLSNVGALSRTAKATLLINTGRAEKEHVLSFK